MEQDNSIIDLTGITFSPAPVPLSCSIIELDDSTVSENLHYGQGRANTSNETSRTEPDSPDVIITSTCHPTRKRKRVPPVQVQEVPKEITRERSPRGRDFGDCPICFDYLGRNPLASTKCGHVFCLKCLEQALKIEKRCPACRKAVKGATGYHPLYFSLN